MPQGGSHTIRQLSQSFTPSRNSDRSVAMAERRRSHAADLSVSGPHRQPSAEVGSLGQGPQVGAEDEAITWIPMPFGLKRLHQQPSTEVGSLGRSPRLGAEGEAITCIPMPFGLKRLGCDSRIAGSHDGGPAGPRRTPTTPQQPTTQSRNQAPEPFTLSGDGCAGVRVCGENSRQGTESGLKGRTTVMIRRTPQDLTQQKLAWELNTRGFADCFDFIYIPLDRGMLARPMAFVNFTSGEAAEKFYQGFNGRPLRCCCAAQPVFVIPATVQGLAQNLSHHSAACKIPAFAGPRFRV